MDNTKNRFFNATTKNDSLVLNMFGDIGESMFSAGITESMVSDALKESPTKNVTININSRGGDAFQGVAIRNVLASSGRKISVNIVGLAASAASVVAMGGDTITMHSGSQMMIHPAQAIALGSASDMRKMADTLDTVTSSIADIYVAKTGMEKDVVLAMMNAETWMNSEEAVSKGFATNVASEKRAVKNSYDLSIFNNVPVELKPENDEPVTDEPIEELDPEDEPEPEVEKQVPISLRLKQLELSKRR